MCLLCIYFVTNTCVLCVKLCAKYAYIVRQISTKYLHQMCVKYMRIFVVVLQQIMCQVCVYYVSTTCQSFAENLLEMCAKHAINYASNILSSKLCVKYVFTVHQICGKLCVEFTSTMHLLCVYCASNSYEQLV